MKDKVPADRLGFAQNFWVNLLAVVLGALTGALYKEAAHHLIPVGKLYLTLLTMTILPIVFSAITHGLGQLLRSGMAGKYIVRLLVVFCISVLIGSTVGVVGGILGNPVADWTANSMRCWGNLSCPLRLRHRTRNKEQWV